jgi:two-component system, LytTR family, response regulator
MTALRALIVDDEALARQRLRRLLEREGDVEVAGECAGGAAAVASIRARAPDVVFLDVRMPEVDGLEVARAVAGAEPRPLFVFVTAFDTHAVHAFDVEALDYLVKPVEPARLGRAVARVREACAARAMPPAPAGPPPTAGAAPLERLLVKADGRMFFVSVADIDYVEARGNYARLHVGPRTHLVRETMAALERRLDPRRFARIHRSTIVNLDRVREMAPWFSGDYRVRLLDGTELRLSRWYWERLEGRLR